MKTKCTRRVAIVTLIGAVTVPFASGSSDKHPHVKIAWKKLEDEPVGPGDFWASEDPNLTGRQGDGEYNLQMQAVHPSEWGVPAKNIGIGNGGHWRPIGIAPMKIPARVPGSWEL